MKDKKLTTEEIIELLNKATNVFEKLAITNILIKALEREDED